MLQHKFVSLFKLHQPISFNRWKEIIKTYTLPDTKTLGVNFHGWEKDGDLGIHFSSSAQPFHVSEFTAYVANVPKKLFSRHLEHELSKLRCEPDKEQRQSIETELYERLLETTPHEKSQVYVIFFESGAIWMCSTNSDSEDATLRSLRTIIQRCENDWDTYSHRINSPIAKRMYTDGCTGLVLEPLITFKVSGRMIHSDSSFADPDYHQGLMKDYPIARITAAVHGEDNLRATLTMDGKLAKIEITETFKSQWKSAGDPKQADELWSVAAGIWVDSLTKLYEQCHHIEASYEGEPDADDEASEAA